MLLPPDLVASVRELTRTVNYGDAEQLLISWWSAADSSRVTACEPELRQLIQQTFLKKRCNRLNQLLTASLAKSTLPEPFVAVVQPDQPMAATPTVMVPRPPKRTQSPATPSRGDADSLPEAGTRVTEGLAMPAASVSGAPDEVMAKIIELNRRVLPRDAEQLFMTWLSEASDAELIEAEPQVRHTLDQLLKKRHKALTHEYDRRVALSRRNSRRGSGDDFSVKANEPDNPSLGEIRLKEHNDANRALSTRRVAARPGDQDIYLLNRLQEHLADLSERHIFQWNTYYRDVMNEFFDPLMDLIEGDRVGGLPGNQIPPLIRDRFERHAKEIFEKGWLHSRNQGDTQTAHMKAENGLRRFLDLPLEVYSARLTALRDGVSPRALRVVASAMLAGILKGFAGADLGDRGGHILPRINRSWVRVTPFITHADMMTVLEFVQTGAIHVGIQTSFLPFAQAIDSKLEDDSDAAPLPRLSDYAYSARRITVSLLPPPQADIQEHVSVQIFLLGDFVNRETLDSAAYRNVILAPFPADLRAYAESRNNLREIVVPTIGLKHGDNPAARLRDILDSTLRPGDDASIEGKPINFNYADTFPLRDLSHAAYRHVERGSVRHLLQRFDGRSGVRLWCSLRRSGKTTSSMFDLGSTSETAAVLAETCTATGNHSVYSAVKHALSERRPIPDDFFKKAVRDALPEASERDRIVFVLDEYEILFGSLRGWSTDTAARFSIVQPLLDQIAEFAQQNLVVFLGQQPDAHYLLMAQNQLSPYVEQDQFPLFTHDTEGYRGEFHDLLQRVLTSHVDYERSFANAVYAETGGHPFLTVNVLVALMDWLIEKGKPRSLLQGGGMNDALFLEFAEAKLTRAEILRQKPFEFFRKAARDALSIEGRETDPWVHSVYAALRTASLNYGPDFAIPRDEFVDVISQLNVDLHDEPDTVISTAGQANFLRLAGGVVKPRIRILSRIAATVTAS